MSKKLSLLVVQVAQCKQSQHTEEHHAAHEDAEVRRHARVLILEHLFHESLDGDVAHGHRRVTEWLAAKLRSDVGVLL